MALSFFSPFRPWKDKEHSTKVPTLIVIGTVAFALLAPMAGATSNRSDRHAGPVRHGKGQLIVKDKSATGGKTANPAKKATTVAHAKPVSSRPNTVPYIYSSAP